jgi:hypothetical protein
LKDITYPARRKQVTAAQQGTDINQLRYHDDANDNDIKPIIVNFIRAQDIRM